MLGGIGAAGAGAVLGGLVGADRGERADAETSTGANHAGIVAFYGPHQAGIATPVQDRILFGAFDVLPGVGRAELVALLKKWTDMTRSSHSARRSAATTYRPHRRTTPVRRWASRRAGSR